MSRRGPHLALETGRLRSLRTPPTHAKETIREKGVTFVDVDRAPFVQVMSEYYRRKEAAGELPDGFLETVEATRKP